MNTNNRYSTSTKALMGRAIDIAVIALLSYFGFLSDVKESIRQTREEVVATNVRIGKLSNAQSECSADIESVRRDLEAHRKAEPEKK